MGASKVSVVSASGDEAVGDEEDVESEGRGALGL